MKKHKHMMTIIMLMLTVLLAAGAVAEKDSPLGIFDIYVPWQSIPVNCDGFVDPGSEWADAAKYDISDTSGQYDGVADPPGVVDLYVKQDSTGVWFAVINHGDTLLEDYDQIHIHFDEDDDGCFPDAATNEGMINLRLNPPAGVELKWRYMQDFDCDAASYECAKDYIDPHQDITLPCYAMGMTGTAVSYEIFVPYGALDHELQVASPVGMEVGFYIRVTHRGSFVYGEWPSQGRATTWEEPCYYGDLICEGPDAFYFKPGYHEYAINGMPDFDQKQDEWDNPPGSGNWTWCGPAAVANCLWWFDSKYQWLIQPGSPQPPAINDDFDLVTAYGDWDDHDRPNVQPFIQDLAWHVDTDGRRTGDGGVGTNVFEMEAGITEWLLATNTDALLWEHTRKAPDFDWIAAEIERCQDVILLLGFWQYYGPGEWLRVGGHYVTCAGVDSENRMLAFSDPYYDMAELAFPGRVGNGILSPHPPAPHGPGIHNDAGNISHDYYAVIDDFASPGGPWSLPDYPVYDNVIISTQFANCPPEYIDNQGTYNNMMPVHTEIEYAVAISPIDSGWVYKGQYPDYAPDGMPDFDQNQHGWGAYCGPTAVANCLWWFDSKYQWLITGGNPPPPFVQDDFNLVTTYIPDIDDHDWALDGYGWDNVQYLIDDLALYLGTDAIYGTKPDDMQAGIKQWLIDRGQEDTFYEHTFIDSLRSPEFFYIIEDEIKRCQDVILLLGFWQEWGTGNWRRVGGHWVTCAGVNSDELMIMFSDPDYDQSPITWPYADPKWHNNAALVSHDVYQVAQNSPSPGGFWWIPAYPESVGFQHAFENCPDHLIGYQDYPETGVPIHTEIEGAVMISPIVAPPGAVLDLEIYTAFGTFAAGSKDIRLIWSPVTTDADGHPMTPDYYVIYRDDDPEFTPGPATEYGTSLGTTLLDINAAGNPVINYYYYVNARIGTSWESANSRCVGEFDKDLLSFPKGLSEDAPADQR